MKRPPWFVCTSITALIACGSQDPTPTRGSADAALDVVLDAGRDATAWRDATISDAADARFDEHRDIGGALSEAMVQDLGVDDATTRDARLTDAMADATRADGAADAGCMVPTTTSREVLVRPNSQSGSELRGTFSIGPVGAFGPAADDATMLQVRNSAGMVEIENHWPPCSVPTSTFACDSATPFFARVTALRTAYPDITFALPVQTAEGAMWVDGEIAVGLRDNVPREQVLTAYAAAGVIVQDAGTLSDRVFASGDVYLVTAQLIATGLFRHVEPNVWVCTPQ